MIGLIFALTGMLVLMLMVAATDARSWLRQQIEELAPVFRVWPVTPPLEISREIPETARRQSAVELKRI